MLFVSLRSVPKMLPAVLEFACFAGDCLPGEEFLYPSRLSLRPAASCMRCPLRCWTRGKQHAYHVIPNRATPCLTSTAEWGLSSVCFPFCTGGLLLHRVSGRLILWTMSGAGVVYLVLSGLFSGGWSLRCGLGGIKACWPGSLAFVSDNWGA